MDGERGRAPKCKALAGESCRTRRRAFASRTALRFTIGGLLFVLVGVALPLKLFTGTDELHTAIRAARALYAAC